MKGRSLGFVASMVCMVLIAAGCGRETTIKRAIPLMGTIVEITATGEDEAATAGAVEDAFEAMRKVDRLMSVYKEDSQISEINRLAGVSPVKVDPWIMDVVKAAIKYGDLSGGAMDVTINPLLVLWGFRSESRRVPEDERIVEVRGLVNYRDILVDEAAGTVLLRREGMMMDFGGIAKGFAVDVAVGALKKRGIEKAIVNAGGDLYALGSPTGRKGWKVGVQHPLKKSGILTTIEVKDRSVATSGNYENFFEVEGKKYCHILNPSTGRPVKGMLSVTILASTAMDADALATAVFVMGRERGMALVESLPHVEGIIVAGEGDENYDILVSSGLKGLLD